MGWILVTVCQPFRGYGNGIEALTCSWKTLVDVVRGEIS